MKKLKILIVEDEIIIRKYVKSILEKLGCEVSGESSTGEEAIELAEKQGPDLIFMDIKLAGKIDGIEAIKKINTLTPIPVAFMSAYDYEKNVRIENIPNCIACLNKPVEAYKLQPVLDKLNKLD